MFLKAFCLLDTKTGIYSQPFFFAHKGLALRAALEMGYDKNTQVGRYPYDFRLVGIGEFDDAVGVLYKTPHDDFGTIGGLLVSNELPRETEVAPDPSEMTSAEVVALREASRA